MARAEESRGWLQQRVGQMRELGRRQRQRRQRRQWRWQSQLRLWRQRRRQTEVTEAATMAEATEKAAAIRVEAAEATQVEAAEAAEAEAAEATEAEQMQQKAGMKYRGVERDVRYEKG